MKLDKTRIIALIILGIITFGVLGFFIYDSLSKGGFDSAGIARVAIVLFASVSSLVKILKGARSAGLTPELIARYRDSYSDIIRGGFTDNSRKSRDFFNAVHLYNKDEIAASIALLERIDRAECSQNERFAIDFFIAIGHDDMGVYNRAIDEYEGLLLYGEHYSVLSNLGVLYRRTGRAKRAIEYFERAIAINPSDATAYNNLANCYLEMADYEAVIQPAERAVSLNSGMASSFSALAISYAMLGKEEQSREALDRAVALGKDRSALVRQIEQRRGSID